MKKFVFVYYGGNKAEDMDPEKVSTVMEAWKYWYVELGDKLLDGGNPFASGAQKILADGTVSEIADDEWPSKGYTIVNAEDMAEAVMLAKGNPMLSDEDADTQIRVYEALPM